MKIQCSGYKLADLISTNPLNHVDDIKLLLLMIETVSQIETHIIGHFSVLYACFK